MKAAIFLLFAILACAFGQTIVSNCTQLQNINLGLNGTYSLNTTINCTGITFTPIANFTGSLNGNNNVILGLSINLNSRDVGLFSSATGASFQNIVFQSASITSNDTNVAVLLASGTNVTITNVHLSNAGTPTSVTGSTEVAGLVGFCDGCAISNSGSSNANIVATDNNAAGVVAFVGAFTTFTQLYSRPSVTLQSGTKYGSGVVGYILGNNAGNGTISNSYSRASINSTTQAGCLIAVADLTNAGVFVQSSYGACTFTNPNSTETGALVGKITTSTAFFTVTNALFLNGTFNGIGNGTTTDGSNTTRLDCGPLYSTIFSTFTQGSIWGGDRLRSEFAYTFGDCSCPSGCPATTTAPTTTAAPTTTGAPTTTAAPTNTTTAPTTTAAPTTTGAPTTAAPTTAAPTSTPKPNSSTTIIFSIYLMVLLALLF